MTMDFPGGRRVALDDAELVVHEACPQRPRELPLVLLHGFPEIAYSWRYQVPALVEAGWHVLAPDQRGYDGSSRPERVEAYDIERLTGDVASLLDRFGYERGIVVGHDWGAIVSWNMALLRPERVAGVAALSVPFMERGPKDWVTFWEERLGPDFYMVHFNRRPGVAEAVFERDVRRFLGNLYRTGQWREPPRPPRSGMGLIDLAEDEDPPGEPLLTAAELDVFVAAFEASGFSAPIHWYRNFTRNWEILGRVEQRVDAPALMIYGSHDSVPQSKKLERFVPDVEIHELDCGHWIQQERPEETNRLLLEWLTRRLPG